MKVDSTSNLGYGQNRKSVRIASSKLFDGGLFVADIKSMPYGVSIQPFLPPSWDFDLPFI